MKRYTAYWIVFVLTLTACEKERPDNVLPKEKMASILKELHIAEAFVSANYAYTDSSRYLFATMRDSIFKAKGVDSLSFDSSMSFYQSDVTLLDEVYSATVDSLSLKEGLAK